MKRRLKTRQSDVLCAGHAQISNVADANVSIVSHVIQRDQILSNLQSDCSIDHQKKVRYIKYDWPLYPLMFFQDWSNHREGCYSTTASSSASYVKVN